MPLPCRFGYVAPEYARTGEWVVPGMRTTRCVAHSLFHLCSTLAQGSACADGAAL